MVVNSRLVINVVTVLYKVSKLKHAIVVLGSSGLQSGELSVKQF
jgi:hypothetical protein